MQQAAFRTTTDLPRHLTIAYALLVVYACLHPFSGWRESGLPPLDFLIAPWPRYYRGIDVLLNVLGYVPLGFTLVPALPRHWPLVKCIWVAVALCLALSLGLEFLQNYLPTRVASNLDLGSNLTGGFLGALLGARFGPPLFAREGGLHRWRSRRIVAGNLGDAGLIVLALWLFTQLVPESLVFASGDFRPLLALPTPLAFSPPDFLRLETAVTASHMLAAGLVARAMMREPSHWQIAVLLILGLAIRTLAGASFLVSGDPFAWATPGCRAGLAIGVPLLVVGLALPRLALHGVAALALLVATALVNLAPTNPYLQASPKLIGESHFLNFHGATRLVSSLWPGIALMYLSLLSARHPGIRQ